MARRTVPAVAVAVALASIRCASLEGLTSVERDASVNAVDGNVFDTNIVDSRGADTLAEAAPDDAGADACSPDPKKDPKNCGACGHDCLGGQCVNGMCQPMVMTTSGSANYRGALAVDDYDVFFSTESTIKSVNKSTLFVDATASGVASPKFIALDSQYVYFVTGDTGAIKRVDKGGATQIDSCGSLGYPSPIAIDNGTLYFTESNSFLNPNWLSAFSAAKCGLDAGPQHMVALPKPPAAIQVRDGYVWWLVNPGFQSLELSRASLGTVPINDAGAHEGLFSADGGLGSSLFVDGARAYFTVNGNIDSAPRQPDAGAGTVTILAAAQNDPSGGIVADAEYVYWANYANNNAGAGSINRCAITGCGAPTILAQGQDGPLGLAQDALTLYWLNAQSGSVMRLAK